MEIKHEQHAGGGSFYIDQEGARKGEMTYSADGPHTIVVEHTQVDDALRGANWGTKLLEEMAAFARAQHLHVVPACRFVHAQFERTGSYNDIWQKE